MLKKLPRKLQRNPQFLEDFYNMLSKMEPFWSFDYTYISLNCAKNATKMVVYSGMNSPAYKWRPIAAHNWAGHRANPRWSAESSHFSPLQQIMHFTKMWLLFNSKMARYSTPFRFIKCCQQAITCERLGATRDESALCLFWTLVYFWKRSFLYLQ